MAFDIYAFDPAVAPRDRYEFFDWISRNFRCVDRPHGDNSRTLPALHEWHRELSGYFPGDGDPHRYPDEHPHAYRNASYRFTDDAVLASFRWEASGAALLRAMRSAQARGMGLFEASGRDGAVWMRSDRGRWEVVYRNHDPNGEEASSTGSRVRFGS